MQCNSRRRGEVRSTADGPGRIWWASVEELIRPRGRGGWIFSCSFLQRLRVVELDLRLFSREAEFERCGLVMVVDEDG